MVVYYKTSPKSLYVYEILFVSPRDLDVDLTLPESFKVHIHTFI